MNNCKRSGKIDALTGFRFMAIMVIIISHLEFIGEYEKIGLFYKTYIHNATLGVDYFFMLSGFGMMLSYQKKSNSPMINGVKDCIMFAKKHVKKIYILYLISMASTIPYYIYMNITAWGGDFQDALLKIVIESIPCIFLVQSAIGLKVFSHSFNSVSWFLSTLFCIYILSPIIMLILTRKPCSKKKLIKKMIFVLITYVIVTVMFIKIENNTFFDDLCYGSPYRRIFYVVFGMLIAMYTNLENNTKIKNKFVPYVMVLLSILWILIRNRTYTYVPVVCYIIDIIICAIIIIVLVNSKGRIVSFFEKPVMVKLGDMSMYLFLIHYPIRMYVGLIWNKLQIHSWIGLITEISIIIAFSMIGSYTCYIAKKKN